MDLRALAAVADLRFATTYQVEGAYSGRHRSRQRGGAAEFVDYREYTAGEDLRRLDWKVLARTGRPYVRLYEDETNLRCMMLIDASHSMRFGGKLEYVQRLTTSIAHVIGRQQDQVGVALAGETLNHVLPPAGTPSHLLSVERAIEEIATEARTNLAGALRELFNRANRRGVLMVFSDFLVDDLDAVFAAARLFRHRRWEVLAMHIVHPDEERLPEGKAFRFDGMEGEGLIDCSPAELRRAYQERFEKHASNVRGLALGARCEYRRVSTATPYMQTLGTFLVERAG